MACVCERALLRGGVCGAHLFCLMNVLAVMRSPGLMFGLCRFVFSMMIAKENR